MIIEDFFTRHTGDTSFFLFGYECNSRYQFDAFFFTSWKWKSDCRGGGGSAVFENFLYRRMYTCIRVIIKPISNAYRIKFFSKNRYLKYKSEPY